MASAMSDTRRQGTDEGPMVYQLPFTPGSLSFPQYPWNICPNLHFVILGAPPQQHQGTSNILEL